MKNKFALIAAALSISALTATHSPVFGESPAVVQTDAASIAAKAQASIDKALAYLKSEQQPDGGS